jgi:hypothetical protein
MSETQQRNGHRTVRRRFWCVEANRDVEVDFIASGLPGFRRLHGVLACPAGLGCRQACLEAAYRHRWAPALPVWNPPPGD